MSEDWQPGDQAECVDVSDIRLGRRGRPHCGGAFLTLGAVYGVRGVSIGSYGELVLDVGAEYGPKLARRFRKVRPSGLSATREQVRELADA